MNHGKWLDFSLAVYLYFISLPCLTLGDFIKPNTSPFFYFYFTSLLYFRLIILAFCLLYCAHRNVIRQARDVLHDSHKADRARTSFAYA